ncbi:MAG: HdeD family acid-resistance protein [Candidatus Sulfotelmatobacter sp.]
MSAQNLTEEVKKRSAWSIFMGVLTAALGAFLIVYPLATATVTTVLLGWVLIFVGIAQFVFALHSQTVGNFFLKVLLGVLSVIAGVALAFFPIEGVEVLTGLLGTLLLVQAGLATVTAFQVRPVEGWGWFLFDAAVSFCMGILILVRWPSSSVWAIGTLVGVAALMGGISKIMIGAKIRTGAGTVERALQRAA